MTTDAQRFTAVLRHRGFQLLLAVRLVGQASDGLVQAALATYVLFSPERAATPEKVAIAFAILLLPYSVIGPFAGVLIDRWRRRQILIGANVLRAALVLVLAWIASRGGEGGDLAIAVLAVLGVNRFILASLSAGTPHVVPTAELVTANAIAPTLGTVSGVVAGLGGVALRTAAGGADTGSVEVLALAAVGYLCAAGAATRLSRDQLGPDALATRGTVRQVAGGLIAGIRHLRARRPAARAIGLIAAQRATFGIAVALAILQVRGALNLTGDTNEGLRNLTVATGFAGLGAFVGAVVTPGVVRRFGEVNWATLAISVFVSLGAVGLATATLPGLFVGGTLVGLGGQAGKVCCDTIVQETVDDEHIGRIFALYDMAVNVAIAFGVTATALLAPLDGTAPLACLAMAVIALVASVLARRAARTA